jgi:single-strand DNA-binding protein
MGLVDAIGIVGSDAELKSTGAGMKVANFSIAVDGGKEKGSNQSKTTWIKVAIFGKLAESLSQYLTKGKLVRASGPVYVETYTHNGQERADIKMNANRIDLLGGARTESKPKPAQPDDDGWPSDPNSEPF